VCIYRRDVSLEESREKCFQGCFAVTSLPARCSSLEILGLTCVGKCLLLCSGSESEEKPVASAKGIWYLEEKCLFSFWKADQAHPQTLAQGSAGAI